MIRALLVSGVLAAPSTSPISDPTDVRGVVRGAEAVSIDPAGAATVDGLELSLRGKLEEHQANEQWGLYAVLPYGPTSIALGYEWLRTDYELRRTTVGAGLRLSPSMSVGLDYRWLHRVRGDSTTAWDASLLVMPAEWLSLSVGVESFNEPRFEGGHLPRTTWVGAGLRPWAGAPWLTVGAEANVRFELDRRILYGPEVLVDLAPLEGLHARVGWAPDDHSLWVGLAATLGSFSVSPRIGRDTNDLAGAGQGAVVATWRGRPTEALVAPHGRTVEVAISGELKPKGALLSNAPPISDVPLALAGLAGDSTIGTVVLDIGELDVGTAQVEELRGVIGALRASGKTVIAELVGGSEKEYLVAAACDRIRLDPAASLELDGYSVTLVYLADFLAKIGVRFDAVTIGRYKTAPDQLTRVGSRPEEREVVSGMLTQLYGSFVRALVQDRHLAPAAVEDIVSRGLVTPADAVRLGLVDELSQPSDPSLLPAVREAGEGLATEPVPTARWGSPRTIAVVPIVGNITVNGAAGLLPGGAADAALLVSQLERVRTDASVRAVVLRIDSPGGEVYASEVIWRAVRLLAATKPVVVSMGDVAASGGYYVAAPAHVILAEPSTITGSIGIFMVKPDLSGLASLAGAHAEIMKIGPRAAWSSPISPLSDEERAMVRRGLAVDYDTFVQHVADGRKLPIERARELASGRAYTGMQALELGLVDGIGGLAEAVAEARDRAGIVADEHVEVRIVQETPSLTSLLAPLTGARPSGGDLLLDSIRRLTALGHVALARLPFEVVVQ